MTQIDLLRLFWEAGLAVGLSFILGLGVGLFAMSYLRKHEKRERKHEIRGNS